MFLQASKKGADQPAHPSSLIRAFVFRFLERRLTKVAAGIKFNILANHCS